MLSAEAFPARTSLLLEREQVFLAVAQAYGQSSPVFLGTYDPATHSLKTFQLLLLEDSTAVLADLAALGMDARWCCLGADDFEQPISANGSGFWPTPVAHEGGQVPCPQNRGRKLHIEVQMFPTPSAISYGSNQGGAAGRVGPVRHSLESMARHDMWPRLVQRMHAKRD